MLLIDYAHRLRSKLRVSYLREVAKKSCPDKFISMNNLAPYWSYIVLLWFEWSKFLINISKQMLLHKFAQSCEIDHDAYLCAIVKIASKVVFKSRKMSGRRPVWETLNAIVYVAIDSTRLVVVYIIQNSKFK